MDLLTPLFLFLVCSEALRKVFYRRNFYFCIMYWVILLLRYVTYFDYSISNKSMGLGTFLVLGPWVTMAAANDKITLILDECCFSPFTLNVHLAFVPEILTT